MKEITINKNDAGQRLDRFIDKAVPLLPASLCQKYIRLKRIKVNGKGSERDYRLQLGDVLSLYINDEFFDKPTEDNAYKKVNAPKLDIVYEDENLLLADKKIGQLCHSADGSEISRTLIANIQSLPVSKGRLATEGGEELHSGFMQPHRQEHRGYSNSGKDGGGAENT